MVNVWLNVAQLVFGAFMLVLIVSGLTINIMEWRRDREEERRLEAWRRAAADRRDYGQLGGTR